MFHNTSFSSLVFLKFHIKNDGRAEELTKLMLDGIGDGEMLKIGEQCLNWREN